MSPCRARPALESALGRQGVKGKLSFWGTAQPQELHSFVGTLLLGGQHDAFLCLGLAAGLLGTLGAFSVKRWSELGVGRPGRLVLFRHPLWASVSLPVQGKS